MAFCKLLMKLGVNDIIICDRSGIISDDREGLNSVKKEMSLITNREKRHGTLADALSGADVFIGVSAPNIVSEEMVSSMNEKCIVFPMSNPTPEIMPDLAKKAGAFIIGTGRSDFPNQINNVLAFPGIFRGALDDNATCINDEMKMATVNAIAGLVSDDEPSPDYILPKAFDPRIGKTVAEEVRKAAIRTGAVRK